MIFHSIFPPSGVTVRVEGNMTTIGRITASDIMVYPSYASVNGPGKVTLRLQAKITNTSDFSGNIKCTVESPTNIDVVFDEVSEKTVPVTVDTTGIAVAHGRGVILLACRKAGVDIFEYTPLQVKQAVVGYGRAEKKQVMDMVKRICSLPAPPRPDDAADAVALALCHARSSTSLLYKGERDECSTI